MASTVVCKQAFALDDFGLALQFHPEVRLENLEQWYIGHSCELSHTPSVNIPTLRTDAYRYASQLEQRAKLFWVEILKSIKLIA